MVFVFEIASAEVAAVVGAVGGAWIVAEAISNATIAVLVMQFLSIHCVL